MTDLDIARRYRNRVCEIEAIQWTGTNPDALRALCGSDFATVDPEDRGDDPDCDAQLIDQASHWIGLKPGDWVLKYPDHLTATSAEAFHAVWEPTPTGGLRDRIARALAEITVGHKAFVTVDVEAEYPRADAVLAALLAPHRPELSWEGRAEHAIGLYTRTAIELEDAQRRVVELEQQAATARADAYRHAADDIAPSDDCDCDGCAICADLASAALLRHLADELAATTPKESR